jgi:CubicO group peptidase (beta-lactamase class C family)
LITLRQLLNHTAGLRDDWDEDDDFFLTRNSNGAFLRALIDEPLKFKPGERMSYGCGAFVVGLVIETITGKSYADFMEERIFRPLAMTSTQINDPFRLIPNRASGYVMREGVLKNGVRVSPAAEGRGDVGVSTTAEDLAKWDAALQEETFLKRRSLDAMFAPTHLNNGDIVPAALGWFLWPVRGRAQRAHGGAFRTGFNSRIAHDLDDRLTVIVLTNLYLLVLRRSHYG